MTNVKQKKVLLKSAEALLSEQAESMATGACGASPHTFSRSKALALLAGASAASLIPGRANAQSAKIRFGATPADTYGQPIYATDMGFFKQAGLDVELTVFPTNGAGMAAIAGGSIDIMGNDAIGFANAVSHGIPLVIIAAGAIYTSAAPTTLLCVAKNSTITQAKDFEGKVIALAVLGGLMYTSIKAWLTQNDADIEKVQFLEFPAAQMGGVLARGTVAGAVIPEPALSASAAVVRGFAKPYDAVAKTFQITTWFTTHDWLAKNPAAAKQLTGALYASSRWANAHQNESLEILAKYAKLDLKDHRNMTRTKYATAVDPALLQPVVDAAVKWNTINKPVDIASNVAKF